MRNFWLEANVDGRETELCGGPRRKDGGMKVSIRQRDEGFSKLVVTVSCYAGSDDSLITRVRDEENNVIAEIVTKR